jgi:hypothetical protein
MPKAIFGLSLIVALTIGCSSIQERSQEEDLAFSPHQVETPVSKIIKSHRPPAVELLQLFSQPRDYKTELLVHATGPVSTSQKRAFQALAIIGDLQERKALLEVVRKITQDQYLFAGWLLGGLVQPEVEEMWAFLGESLRGANGGGPSVLAIEAMLLNQDRRSFELLAKMQKEEQNKDPEPNSRRALVTKAIAIKPTIFESEDLVESIAIMDKLGELHDFGKYTVTLIALDATRREVIVQGRFWENSHAPEYFVVLRRDQRMWKPVALVRGIIY